MQCNMHMRASWYQLQRIYYLHDALFKLHTACNCKLQNVFAHSKITPYVRSCKPNFQYVNFHWFLYSNIVKARVPYCNTCQFETKLPVFPNHISLGSYLALLNCSYLSSPPCETFTSYGNRFLIS
jgi:hypothetical protein